MPAQHDSTQHPQPITVVVVDDEPMIRGALAQTLTAGGLDLVGEASSARDALRLVVDVRPDVVLMDLRLPDSPGVRAIEQLALLAPASRILILTRTEQNRVVEAIVAPAATSSRPRHPKRSLLPSGPPRPESQSSPPRWPENCYSGSASETSPSPPPATTPPAPSAPR